jgi:hypothetical protein
MEAATTKTANRPMRIFMAIPESHKLGRDGKLDVGHSSAVNGKNGSIIFRLLAPPLRECKQTPRQRSKAVARNCLAQNIPIKSRSINYDVLPVL